MNAQSGLQLSDLRGVVRRRAKVVLGTALLVALASYWIAMALPNQYESYATVLVEPQAVDPNLVESGVASSDLNKRLHLMAAQILSRPRLSRIIDELGLYEAESREMVRDEVISLMRDQIRVEPVVPELQGPQAFRREFEIDQFRINFRHEDAVVARDVAQRLANDFIKEHIANRVRTSQKSLEFIDAEQARLSGEIQKLEAQIGDLKAANAGKLPEDMGTNQRKLERLTQTLAAARRDAALARSDEAFFATQSVTARELIRSERDGPEARIRELEIALANYASRGLTEKHPDVLIARGELEQLKAQIAAQRAESGGASFAEHSANAEAQRARRRMLEAQVEMERLDAEVAGLQALLAEIPKVAEQLDALEREYRHLFSSYQDFSNRRLEASVQADLERRQLGEQFRVLEAAFLAPEPSSPNRPVIIIIGIVFGLALGAGLGLVLETSDASVHDSRSLQSVFKVPVLASIPQIRLEADLRRERRQRLRTALATMGVVMFALVGGAANYLWVNGTPGRPEISTRGEAPAELPSEAPVE